MGAGGSRDRDPGTGADPAVVFIRYGPDATSEQNHKDRRELHRRWKRTWLYRLFPGVRALIALSEAQETLLEARGELITELRMRHAR